MLEIQRYSQQDCPQIKRFWNILYHSPLELPGFQTGIINRTESTQQLRAGFSNRNTCEWLHYVLPSGVNYPLLFIFSSLFILYFICTWLVFFVLIKFSFFFFNSPFITDCYKPQASISYVISDLEVYLVSLWIRLETFQIYIISNILK